MSQTIKGNRTEWNALSIEWNGTQRTEWNALGNEWNGTQGTEWNALRNIGMKRKEHNGMHGEI